MLKVIIALLLLISISYAQYWNPYQARYYGRTQYASPVVGYIARPQYVSPGRVVEDESPKPFSFGYDNTDEFGTRSARQEVGDASGTVKGSYSYRDAKGQFRTVTYVADHDGYRAVVDTNEPGVIPHKPADVVYNVYQ